MASPHRPPAASELCYFHPALFQSFAVSGPQMEVEQGQADKLGMEAEGVLDQQSQSSSLPPIMQPLSHEPMGPFFQQKFLLIQLYTSSPKVPSF